MKQSANADLKDLYRVLQISADGFVDAIVLLSQLPQEEIEKGIQSCERWLEMLNKELKQFKFDILGVNDAQK